MWMDLAAFAPVSIFLTILKRHSGSAFEWGRINNICLCEKCTPPEATEKSVEQILHEGPFLLGFI